MHRHGGCKYRSHMSQLRLAALVTLLAAGCYSEAAPQSTLPEPQYVAGPPGGAIDPGYAYATDGSGANVGSGIAATDPADPADDDDRDDDTDPAANGGFDPARDPSVGAPSGSAPGAPAPTADDVAQLDGAARFGTTSDRGDPTASVTDEEIDATLDGQGEWVQTDDYGQVWRPDATVVGVDFTPYESGGSWTYTDAGWAFACDYPWGWLPFHYGRWGWFDGFWGWAPDYYWGPAWVEWRHGGGIVGWRPLPPRHRDHRDHGHRWHDRDAPVRDHRRARQYDAHWRFAAVSDFSRPHVRSHLFGNAAEGLRMTSAVAAPPIRGRAPVRAADLMRIRSASSGRSVGSKPRVVRMSSVIFSESYSFIWQPKVRMNSFFATLAASGSRFRPRELRGGQQPHAGYLPVGVHDVVGPCAVRRDGHGHDDQVLLVADLGAGSELRPLVVDGHRHLGDVTDDAPVRVRGDGRSPDLRQNRHRQQGRKESKVRDSALNHDPSA